MVVIKMRAKQELMIPLFLVEAIQQAHRVFVNHVDSFSEKEKQGISLLI